MKYVFMEIGQRQKDENKIIDEGIQNKIKGFCLICCVEW